MMKMLSRLWKDESGQGMVEYGLIIALVAVAVIAVLTLMGTEIKSFFQHVVDTLQGNKPAAPTT